MNGWRRAARSELWFLVLSPFSAGAWNMPFFAGKRVRF